MKRLLSLLSAAAMCTVMGCLAVTGVGDYKKEGEGGRAAGEACAAVAECGAGLNCVNGACRVKCYDLVKTAKQCGTESCVPLDSHTEAVCFPTADATGGPCAVPLDCAPGLVQARAPAALASRNDCCSVWP